MSDLMIPAVLCGVPLMLRFTGTIFNLAGQSIDNISIFGPDGPYKPLL